MYVYCTWSVFYFVPWRDRWYTTVDVCMLYVICFNFCTSARLLLRTRVCFVARTCTLRIPEYVRLVLMCGAFDTALAGVWCFDVLDVWMRLVWYLPQMLNVWLFRTFDTNTAYLVWPSMFDLFVWLLNVFDADGDDPLRCVVPGRADDAHRLCDKRLAAICGLLSQCRR